MRARAPGSVTLVFAPADRGARGVSLAVADGVEAAVEPASSTCVTLDGEPTPFEPVELALGSLGVDARVDLSAECPVGRGFGASGAATLATCLAADAAFDLGHSRECLIDVAACAEIEAGTGLGDVHVQARGGLVFDAGEGRDRRDRDDELAYVADAPIPTAEVLGDDRAMARVRRAGEAALSEFDPDWPLNRLLEWGWEFTEATGLATDGVRERVGSVHDGGAASMAMVGETVVTTPEASLPGRTRIDPEGARLLE